VLSRVIFHHNNGVGADQESAPIYIHSHFPNEYILTGFVIGGFEKRVYGTGRA